MTACINPNNGNISNQVSRSDPKVRLQDYENSLKFWLTLNDSRIKKLIFIDNSGYPLDSLIQTAESNNIWQRKYEFISLNCNDTPQVCTMDILNLSF
ncbi:MAG: hypothetical protein HC908_02810 [Calothrix sp. SM1_7_51]|nr:hypothetical protein [Calothrix sp. SM1_7_51]